MKNKMKNFFLIIAGALTITGCGEPGPAEKAGKEIDKKAEETKDSFNEKRDSTLESLKSK